jgi:hypothetical protein
VYLLFEVTREYFSEFVAGSVPHVADYLCYVPAQRGAHLVQLVLISPRQSPLLAPPPLTMESVAVAAPAPPRGCSAWARCEGAPDMLATRAPHAATIPTQQRP